MSKYGIVHIPGADFATFVDALENLLDAAKERGDRYNIGYIGKMVENADGWLKAAEYEPLPKHLRNLPKAPQQ